MFWKKQRYQFQFDDDIPLLTPVEHLSFIVFDMETTGFDVAGADRLLEIGAVYVDKLEVTDETFQTYVNPERNIPDVITELTGIDEQKVKAAPDAKAAIDELFTFIANFRCNFLVGHFMNFDLSVIEHELKRANCSCSKPKGVDTLELLQLLNVCIHGKDLKDFANEFGVTPVGRHTASGDATTTAHLACQLLTRLKRRYRTWGELLIALERQKRVIGI